MAFIWISLAVFIVAVYIILRLFIVRSFVEHEAQNTIVNVDRVQNAIAQQVDAINAKASDWAAWDDAYQFVQDGNTRFIQSNIVLSAFTGLNLNLIAYQQLGRDPVREMVSSRNGYAGPDS